MTATLRRRLLPVRSETYEAVIDGQPGERHLRSCQVCSGALVVGDTVYVTASYLYADSTAAATERPAREVIHAIAHAPDCVRALEREMRGEG